MRYIYRLILILVVLGGIGIVGYAYFGDLSPEMRDIRQPVTLDVD